MIEALLLVIVVGGAIFYLGRRAWLRLRGARGSCCGGCQVGPPKIGLAGRPGRGFSAKKMHTAAVFLLATASGLSVVAAQLTPKQRAGAERIAALTVPSPTEFFAAIDKAGKPDWMSFYREPVPTTYSTRSRTALNLGALVTDGYVAVEAQDGQQVKNTGKDIIALAGALGVGADVLVRGKSIADFADQNDWFALREELEATTNEVRRGMIAQRDEALASLITAGAWLRALEVGSRAAELSGEDKAAGLLHQAALVGWLRGELQLLPEKVRSDAAVIQTDLTLASLEETIQGEAAAEFGEKRVLAVKETTAQFIAAMAAKEP